jgi:thiosulfate dehydrogenase [quinone] large subunit
VGDTHASPKKNNNQMIHNHKTSIDEKSVSATYTYLRIGFGLVWVIDAALKYQPAFYHGILTAVKGSDAGSVSWLNPWFHFWYRTIGAAPMVWAVLIIAIETLIALSLLLGVARRANYILGAIFSFFIWSIAEGFGGPYVAGSTDIGAGIIYVFVFIALLALDNVTEPQYCLDTIIANRYNRDQNSGKLSSASTLRSHADQTVKV